MSSLPLRRLDVSGSAGIVSAVWACQIMQSMRSCTNCPSILRYPDTPRIAINAPINWLYSDSGNGCCNPDQVAGERRKRPILLPEVSLTFTLSELLLALEVQVASCRRSLMSNAQGSLIACVTSRLSCSRRSLCSSAASIASSLRSCYPQSFSDK